jgi:hypothetical protein
MGIVRHSFRSQQYTVAPAHRYSFSRSVSQMTGERGAPLYVGALQWVEMSQKISSLALVCNAQHWRVRAAGARSVAELHQDPKTKSMMLDVARSYDRLAENAEKRGPSMLMTFRSGRL